MNDNTSETSCWVIASRPYAEKVLNATFYLIREDALDAWGEIDSEIRGSFNVYPATLVIELERITSES